MDPTFRQNICNCTETQSFVRNKLKKRREGRPASYPVGSDIQVSKVLDRVPPETWIKTFQIQCNHELSLHAKVLLNSFQKKYIYYAIDDIKYKQNLSLKERDELLEFLYSPVLSLHNSYSVEFFDIWIHNVYINKIVHSNRFLKEKSGAVSQIILTMIYKTKKPAKPKESLW